MADVPMGFAGLVRLVSDVSADVAAVPDPPPPSVAGQVKADAPGPVQIHQKGRTSNMVRAVVIAITCALSVGIFMLVLSSLASSPTTPLATAAEIQPKRVLAPGPANRPILRIPGAQSLGSSPLTLTHEVSTRAPAPGTDRVLRLLELRWCHFQRSRVEAARAAVVSNHGAEVFNALVTDYNSRCSQYRYMPHELETAKADAEQCASRLRNEGVALVADENVLTPEAIGAAASAYALPPGLLEAIVEDSKRVRANQARVGRMLVSAAAADDAGVGDPTDPIQNLEAGARRLRYYANRHSGDMVNTLAAYWLEADIFEGTTLPPDAERFVRRIVAGYRVRKKQRR